MLRRKKKTTVIPAEKMALLAEKGFRKARLSRAEKIALAEQGLAEFYTIKEGITTAIPPSDPQLVEEAMAIYSSTTDNSVPLPSLMDISVQLTRTAIKLIQNASNWQPESPAFAQRGGNDDRVSFYKDAGKFTVHFEITKGNDLRSCITVKLTANSNREQLSFDAALFQNNKCIESVHVLKNHNASFSSVATGDYSVKVCI